MTEQKNKHYVLLLNTAKFINFTKLSNGILKTTTSYKQRKTKFVPVLVSAMKKRKKNQWQRQMNCLINTEL